MNPANPSSQSRRTTTTTASVMTLQGGGNERDRYSIPATRKTPTIRKIIQFVMPISLSPLLGLEGRWIDLGDQIGKHDQSAFCALDAIFLILYLLLHSLTVSLQRVKTL